LIKVHISVPRVRMVDASPYGTGLGPGFMKSRRGWV
jgi:hypothetical protein